MGACLGGNERDSDNKLLNQVLEKEKKQVNKCKKLLLLGSRGSGKSTIFKQLRGIYGKGFHSSERVTFIAYIHEQCITQMKLAVDLLDEYKNGDMNNILHQNVNAYNNDDDSKGEEDEEFDAKLPELSESAVTASKYLETLHYTQYKLNDDIVAAVKCLWQEPAIKKMYELRNITKIETSSAHFWGKLDLLNSTDYCPDEADILLVSYRTPGATEEKYEMPDNKGTFSIVDVGGSKMERKKWIKCFDGVTAVIFVASLSCYDEVLYEDYSTNAMTDQLELFDDICNNEALKETSMILFLNKKDLFAEKIKKVDLQKCPSFSEYKGLSDSFDETTKYIRKAFTSLNNNPNRKNIFTHITCACDQDNIQKVFADVQHIVIEASLIQAGLMDWDDNQRYKSMESTVDVHVDDGGGYYVEMPTFEEEKNDDVQEYNARKISRGFSIIPNDIDEDEDTTSCSCLTRIADIINWTLLFWTGLHLNWTLILFVCECCKSHEILVNGIGCFNAISTAIIISFYGFLYTEVYDEVQSWMIAYIGWITFIWSQFLIDAFIGYYDFAQLTTLSVIRMKILGISLTKKTRLYAHKYNDHWMIAISSLLPTAVVGFLANYMMEEQFLLRCDSKFKTGDICHDDGGGCCILISSYNVQNTFNFAALLASHILAAVGFIRIIAWFMMSKSRFAHLAKKD